MSKKSRFGGLPKSLARFASMFALAAGWNVGIMTTVAQEGGISDFSTISAAALQGASANYVTNRAPLHLAPFLKLPIGSVQPQGWLRKALLMEAEGMTGKLKQISPWLKPEANAWADKEGKGHSGWEELPYWLKGFGDLGYILQDKAIMAEAQEWIERVLASQREDGWFGPRELLTSLKGKPDLWPHMVMLNVLQSYFEYSGDKRVVPFMTRYFAWQHKLPASAFGEGYWPKLRAGDNIESIHWLYNRIEKPNDNGWLLELSQKIQENMADWKSDVIDWHNVNIAQGFRASAMFYPQSGNENHLSAAERNYQKVMGIYGQFPGGGFGGDENCRQGYIDPRQGFETCGIVEFTHSFELLTRISGNPVWADRCEYIAFNDFPAATTPDLKGLHYLTCANQVQLDRGNKAPGIQNGGTMFSYSPFEVYRCCQHNVSHGWPYYAEELWLGSWDGGLCASLYSASVVKAKVGSSKQEVTLSETTDYPFGEVIRFKLTTSKAVRFPLYLRIPGWCEAPALAINGKAQSVSAKPQSYLAVNRLWANGDQVELRFPMKVTTQTWAKNMNSVSVNYGPLTFSLKIGEKWTQYGKNSQWPEWEVFPTTSWNYGLELDPAHPEKSIEVVRKKGSVSDWPFTPKTAPIELKAKARKIPNWQQDRLGLVGLLQPSPAKTVEPVESVTLIPMGAACLRISAFPTVSTASDAHEWVAAPQSKPLPYKVSASHVYESDTVEALCDGLEPANSNDHDIPRFTWWPHKGQAEWVQYDFNKPRSVSEVSVYWFDDSPGGGCRVPKSWRVLYQNGDKWSPVEAATPGATAINTLNLLQFKSVKTTALRLEVQLQDGFSGGILEWKIKE